jgi:hypothetical protein
MRKINLMSIGVLASLLWAGAVCAEPPMPPPVITKTLTFSMPACPIEATTVPPTKTEFTLPEKNPRGVAISVAGTVQVIDQNAATILRVTGDAEADSTGVSFSRTVSAIGHLTGSVDFDHGCTATDPYGSNHCSWTWGETISAAFEGDLQEDITSGKLLVDLKVDNTIPFSFSCPVCGAKCAITIPQQLDHSSLDKVWVLMIRLIRFPLGLTKPPVP